MYPYHSHVHVANELALLDMTYKVSTRPETRNRINLAMYDNNKHCKLTEEFSYFVIKFIINPKRTPHIT